MQAALISVISPVYYAEKTLSQLVSEIIKELGHITNNYEIILVEDHSPDNSWLVIENLCKQNNSIKGIKLSRNFGQHYAISTGLDFCKGDWVFVMDCDLQDRPDQIHKLYNKAIEGYDIVQGKRIKRKDGFVKKGLSRVFYKILAYLSGYNQDETIANYGIYSKRVIQSIVSMRENIRFFPTMVSWVGFRKTSVEIEHAYRAEGKSTYNFKKLFNLGLDIILAYSDKPLRLMIKIGLLMSFTSFIFLLYNLYKYLAGYIIVMGYMSLIVSIWFLSGIIMLMLGVVGLYVGKTFESTKNRPIYIVEEKINFE